MPEIKWLHISDLHFNGNRHDHYDANIIFTPLLNTVENFQPDLIFVTGDIGFSGKEEDYKLAENFLQIF